MPEVRKVGAWVTTAGGADVEEYALEVVDDRTVLCYISSEENKVSHVCALFTESAR